jgi:CRISPR-associated protein Csm2
MQQNQYRGSTSGSRREESDQELRQIVERIRKLNHMSELKPEDFAEEDGLADKFARNVKDKLKATQLRRFFHEIKNLKLQFKTTAFNRTKIALLMPMLAYAKGRKVIPDAFYDLMKECFGSRLCQTSDDFDRAVDFLEAILAYHKIYARQS